MVIGGSKGDDIATYDALLEELGLTEDQMGYITYDSTGDAITAALGGNLDFVISKPAAASQYVESGDLTPTLAPVSYTHLDVYKRQVTSSSRKR